MFWSRDKKEKTLGEMGEDVAVKYLKRKGYKILERNYFNKFGRRIGEIDIIAMKKQELVFVEVKTRMMGGYQKILPEENINRAKLYKLSKIANFYVKRQNHWNKPYRFDAISIIMNEDLNKAGIKHMENIFI